MDVVAVVAGAVAYRLGVHLLLSVVIDVQLLRTANGNMLVRGRQGMGWYLG